MPHTKRVGYALVAVGLIGVVLGVGWKQIVPNKVFWTEAQAREYTEAFEAAHAETSGHDHSHVGAARHSGSGHDGRAGHASARARFEAIEGELQSAREYRGQMGRLLSIAGGVAAIKGLLLGRVAGNQPS